MKLFDQIIKENDYIKSRVFPRIEKQANEALKANDIESIKDATHKQSNANARLEENNKMLAKLLGE